MWAQDSLGKRNSLGKDALDKDALDKYEGHAVSAVLEEPAAFWVP